MLIKNIYLWTIIVFLTIINLSVQFYVNFSSSLHTVVWVSWFSLVSIAFFFTDIGLQLKQLLNQTYQEAKKIVWPTKQETIQTTLIVIVMVAITGLILWLLDNAMIWIIAKLTRLG